MGVSVGFGVEPSGAEGLLGTRSSTGSRSFGFRNCRRMLLSGVSEDSIGFSTGAVCTTLVMRRGRIGLMRPLGLASIASTPISCPCSALCSNSETDVVPKLLWESTALRSPIRDRNACSDVLEP